MPCFKGMPERVGDEPFSGCRVDCLHRAHVKEYRGIKTAMDETRKIEEERANRGARATDSGRRAWLAAHPAFTFKQYLIDHRRPPEEPEESAA